MIFLRTYLTIGSVVAALRIIWTVIVTQSNKLYKFYTNKDDRVKWLLERPFVQALNCLASIGLWPLDIGGTIAFGIKYCIRVRRELNKKSANSNEDES